jgi:GTP-binding protein
VYLDEREFVLADIPGLIEGASEGVGLGLRFLGHVERCGILLHLIDGTQDDVAEAYRIVRGELEAYDDELAAKPEIVALNKCDALSEDEITEKKAALEAASAQDVRILSGATHLGVQEVLRDMLSVIDLYRAAQETQTETETADESDPHTH